MSRSYSRPARFVIALVIVLSTMLVPAEPAVAAGMGITPAFGPPTTKVRISGVGFAAYDVVDIYFDATYLTSAYTDANGDFSGVSGEVITIPASAAPGPHKIILRNSGTPGAAAVTFTVRTDWRHWRGNATGRALNPTENQLVPSALGRLDESSTFSTSLRYVYSPPVVYNGLLYVHTTAGRLMAFDIATRNLLWNVQASLGENPPVIAGSGSSALVITSGPDSVRAFHALNGVLAWRAYLGGNSYTTPPTVAGGVVYVGGFDDTNVAQGVYAYSTNCGLGGVICTPLWRGRICSPCNPIAPEWWPAAAPIVGGGKVILRHESSVYAFTVGCGTGGFICPASYQLNGLIGSGTPAFANGYFYVPGREELRVVRAATGSPVWTGTFTGDAGSVALDGGRVFVNVTDWYIGSGNFVLAFKASGCGASFCPSVDSGPGLNFGDITLAGGVLWVQDDDGLMALDQRCLNCGDLWRATVPYGIIFGAPTIVDGVVYAATGERYVQTYDLNAVSAMTASGAAYTEGSWTNEPVNVRFSCADNPDDCSTQSEVSVETAAVGYHVNETAVSIASEARTTDFVVRLDRTAPTIAATATTVDGRPYVAGTPTSQPVTVRFTCSDALSGIATCPAEVIVSDVTPSGGQLVRGVAVDAAGNHTVVTLRVVIAK